jgi:nicotinamidase-related amidase
MHVLVNALDPRVRLRELAADTAYSRRTLLKVSGRGEMCMGFLRRALLAAAAFGAVAAVDGIAPAQTIIDDWSKVTPPPAPALKPAALEAKTTALLVMDFVKQTCSEKSRPRCVASIPKVKAMIDAAKAKNVMIVWTIPPGPKPEDFLPEIAPPPDTKFLVANVDKFYNPDLDQMLKAKGITTVITTGTSSYGAVLFTTSGALVRGYNVVVPVDGMSAGDAYGDQSTAWILANFPGAANRVTMTRSDMIAYK